MCRSQLIYVCWLMLCIVQRKKVYFVNHSVVNYVIYCHHPYLVVAFVFSFSLVCLLCDLLCGPITLPKLGYTFWKADPAQLSTAWRWAEIRHAKMSHKKETHWFASPAAHQLKLLLHPQGFFHSNPFLRYILKITLPTFYFQI